MRVIVVDSYETMSKKAAELVRSQIALKPDCVLGFATGNTPLGMYKELVRAYGNHDIDFHGVFVFNLDEYCNLEKENTNSYHSYMKENLFRHVNIDKKRTFMLDGQAVDVNQECKDYEEQIKRVGGIDLQILGIGKNGHIGFNEPAINFEADTHLVNLASSTIEANEKYFGSAKLVPTTALSMGIKTILQSKMLVLLASGEKKAAAIYQAVNGKICPEVPASILQLHSNVTLIIEKEAARLIPIAETNAMGNCLGEKELKS